MKKRLKIAILSRNPNLYSTQRLKKAGELQGHEMHVIDHTKCDIVIEQKKPQIFYRGEELKGFEAIIPRIGTSVTFYGAAVVRQFEMQGVFSATKSQSLLQSRDKLRSLQLLSSAGLGLPKTAFTNYSRDVASVINQVGGAPCVIKLLEGTQGIGVVLAETTSAANSVLEAFNGLQARVIVQEFIAEAKGADIRAFVVDGVVVGAIRRQSKEGEFRANLHRGGTAYLIKLTKEEEITALKATQTLGLGIAGVDMLESDSGPMILEVNASPGLEGIEGATKKDIAGAIIRYVEKNVL
ncbi:MAG: 30S ribosomal protein S6--L-glutamate ligase [Aureispira sp.]|nr:30S ribosomal protein S6--L-glutamate ligase [Aureispira sp.]